ncbi:hypothetical protein ACM9HF_05545 [Colwellia sp. RE-S-Sl-9]
MSITMNTSNPAMTQTDTAQGIKTAGLAKSQAEIEGQMALRLIQSANVAVQPAGASTEALGSIVNISV